MLNFGISIDVEKKGLCDETMRQLKFHNNPEFSWQIFDQYLWFVGKIKTGQSRQLTSLLRRYCCILCPVYYRVVSRCPRFFGRVVVDCWDEARAMCRQAAGKEHKNHDTEQFYNETK